MTKVPDARGAHGYWLKDARLMTGAELQAARNELGLTMRQMAEATGYTCRPILRPGETMQAWESRRGTALTVVIWRMETGRRAVPNRVARLVRYFQKNGGLLEY